MVHPLDACDCLDEDATGEYKITYDWIAGLTVVHIRCGKKINPLVGEVTMDLVLIGKLHRDPNCRIIADPREGTWIHFSGNPPRVGRT
ncbi:hypothetical protein [Streptomyces sp. CoH17]|uniref:hypothetical protein n=1 Tax=Streptomyces sp. CoH17 TaxID=2992806 RepID=UPI00226DE06D|nr:hypothetical protein [Streptomyces sp. CoH17]